MAKELQTQQALVTLTGRAASKVKEYMAKEGKGKIYKGLRVRAERDACNCLSYSLELEKVPESDDIIFEEKGLKVFVDPKSVEMVRGASIDYVKTSKGEGFRISGGECGPECGCT
jgi:iron-sulfur cluster assembly protein